MAAATRTWRTVSIAVAAINDLPVANADAYATNEDTLLTVNAPGVLANDTDADGNPLDAILVSGPSHGTLTLQANGSFTYTPAANFSGADAFSYKANDGSGDSNVATVSIAIAAINDLPVAIADAYATNEGAVLTVNAPGVLANDTDADGNPLSAILVSGPSHGTLTLQRQWLVHLHAGGRLLRRRCVHLQGERWQRRLERGDRVDRDRAVEPPANRQRRYILDERGHAAERQRAGSAGERQRSARPHPDGRPRPRSAPRHADEVRGQRIVQVQTGAEFQRHRHARLSRGRRRRPFGRRDGHARGGAGERQASGGRRHLSERSRARRSTCRRRVCLGNDTDADGATLTAVLSPGRSTAA